MVIVVVVDVVAKSLLKLFNGDNQMSYDDAVRRMKDALNDKINWMTSQISMM